MVLGFKKRFVQPIFDGTKIHTLRCDPYNRWKPGVRIHMATGTRTKHYNCFKSDIFCVTTQEIIMRITKGRVHVLVDKRLLLYQECLAFIKNDGFQSTEDFIQFFGEGELRMKLIHWTDFKY